MPYIPSTFGIFFFEGKAFINYKTETDAQRSASSLVTTEFKSYLQISFILTSLEHQSLLSQQVPFPRDAKPLCNCSMPIKYWTRNSLISNPYVQ